MTAPVDDTSPYTCDLCHKQEPVINAHDVRCPGGHVLRSETLLDISLNIDLKLGK